MRFHVVSLPHTQTTKAYSSCAYTVKVINFCRMMKDLGHKVFLYAGEENEAPCDELITCISEDERKAAVGEGHYTSASFDGNLPHWKKFNALAARGIIKRYDPQDFVCIIGGLPQKQIATAVPELMCVEFGVGYGGQFAEFRVFESYAWMHTCYGAQAGNPHDANGRWFDEVIPGYIDPDIFPFSAEKDDYFLFVGRMVERKGIQIAAEVCKKMGKRLVVAGFGGAPEYGEYVGSVSPEQRGHYMAKAKALFVPTLYIEPFGNVAVEAMACGTPVICTDWGAMTETVIDGVTGFRCRSFSDFCGAVNSVGLLDPFEIRKHALDNYSLDVVGKKYENYFQKLSTLWGEGWYANAA